MKRLIGLFCLLAVSSLDTLAQAPGPDLQQGMTPYAAFQNGEIDSINFGSGNAEIHIPLVSFPQRGGKLRLAFNFYDTNKNWYIYTNGSQSTWTFVGTTLPGGAYVSPDQRILTKTSLVKWQDGDGLNWTIKVTNGITADGASHEILYPDQRSAHGLNVGHSSDATGIYYTNPDFFDNAGNEYTASTTMSAPGNVIDSNGNEITYGSSGWTDTLGRVIPGYPTSGTMITAPGVSSSTTNCPSGTVSALQWNVPAYNGVTAPYKFCYSDFSYHTAFNYPGVNEASGTALMISAIVLPNLTKWVFNYDTYLGISSVTFPTGGTVTYSWTTSPFTGKSRVIASRTTNANDGTGAHTWNYQWAGNNLASTLTLTDPLLNDTVYTSANSYVTEAQYYAGSHSSGTLLKTVTTQYSPMVVDPLYNTYGIGDGSSRVNVVPLSQTTTWPNGQTMQTTTSYDPGFQYGVYDFSGTLTNYNAYYGLPVTEATSDYGQGSPGGTLSQKNTVYYWQNYSSYLTANLLTLPQTIKLEDAGGNPCAETDYTYDNASYLTSSGISTQHTTPPASIRGNVSSVTSQLSSASSPCQANPSWTPITFYTNAYDTGKVYKSIDPLGHTITYGYSTSFAGAYATTITNALSQNRTNNYDFNTGALTSTTDLNLLQTTYAYDNMSRLTQVNLADGGQSTITRQETSTPYTATLTKKINSSQSVVTMNVVDGLGRIYRNELTSDPQGTIYKDMAYDALGRVASVSNPYRLGTDITTSTGTTTYGYDALNRNTSETYADGSVLTTAYCGPSTLVTDPVGKWRRSLIDGLNRLIEVDEPNATGASVASTGCRGTGEPIWVTSYSFDNLENMTKIIQNGTHQRTFTYDSLSRLITSANPEVGTITYSYNNDSVLVSKTDARGITANYNPSGSPIDALHRVTEITYSNSDPTITYAYDQSTCLGLSVCQNIGHITSMTDAAGSEAWAYEVDHTNLRSIHVDKRTTSTITKTSTYYFDLAGNINQAVYPTGRTVNYTYDAADRPSIASDASNGITYATGFKTSPGGTCLANITCYTPQGSIYGVSIGQTSSFTGLNITDSYNSRLEPLEFKASSTAGSAIDITYSFADPSTHKNAGHVYSITNNLNSSRTQTFAYDQVNRIVSAGTSATTGTLCWGYLYTYDAWGNLTSQAGWTPTYSACSEGVMNPVTADGNNHISAFGYDAAGNATNDGLYSYSWNGESQLKSAAGVAYIYDGNGRRVSKVGSKLYWYGAGGEILAETDPSGNTLNEYVYFGGKRIALLPASSTAQFYVEDSLGSSRIVTTNTGAVCYDADFTPYGAERAVTSSCTQNNYKFEGKERDTETGNDEFGARYYTNRFGRWLSADWSNVPLPVPYANLINPQTLNLYAMTSDDPESFADLDGHNLIGVIPTSSTMVSINGTEERLNILGGPSPTEPGRDLAKDASEDSTAPQAGAAQADATQANTTQTNATPTASAQSQNAGTPAPTNPDGTPKPPPTPPPPGADGKPNEWVRTPGTNGKPDSWDPKNPVPSPKGGQPRARWDEKNGHWDIDDGRGNRTRRLPDGTKVDHNNKPIAKHIVLGVTVGVTAYVTYRVIRMLPSLLPPLWETIPLNAAIP
jgi:RHS repeat-associated protein